MAATTEEWSCNANDAVTISLVQPSSDGLTNVQEFHPKFTYPIFGEAEQVFGYKGLKISIQFAAHSGSPHVDISYDRKFPQVGSTTALDLNGTLKDFLPASAFQSGYDVQLRNDEGAKDWTPPGSLVRRYSKQGRDFEVWAGSLLDPKVRELLDNIQIFVLFFIEAGSMLNTTDVDWTLDRWRIYFVYEKRTPPSPSISPYSLVGYATTYRFYRFSPARPRPKTTSMTAFPNLESITPRQLTSRLRISQFLILPPYQSSGHGSALYQAIYEEVMADATVIELTVEDPSEEFDKLRDACDWKVLEPEFRAAGLNINASAPASSKARINRVPTGALLPLESLKTIRVSKKIAPRQFSRQVELYLLSLVPFSHRAKGGASLTKLKIQKHKNSNLDDRVYYWWRILLKQRIVKKNKDLLQQVELEERFPQIEDSARGQEDEYEGLLLLFALRQAEKEGMNGNGGEEAAGTSSQASSSRKRKVVVEEEDEEDEDSSKRARS